MTIYYFAFDLLATNGQNLVRLPLLERKWRDYPSLSEPPHPLIRPQDDQVDSVDSQALEAHYWRNVRLAIKATRSPH